MDLLPKFPYCYQNTWILTAVWQSELGWFGLLMFWYYRLEMMLLFQSHLPFYWSFSNFYVFLYVAQEADRNNNGKAAHSAWRNYDDFNEYFWFVIFLFCFWLKYRILLFASNTFSSNLLCMEVTCLLWVRLADEDWFTIFIEA